MYYNASDWEMNTPENELNREEIEEIDRYVQYLLEFLLDIHQTYGNLETFSAMGHRAEENVQRMKTGKRGINVDDHPLLPIVRYDHDGSSAVLCCTKCWTNLTDWVEPKFSHCPWQLTDRVQCSHCASRLTRWRPRPWRRSVLWQPLKILLDARLDDYYLRRVPFSSSSPTGSWFGFDTASESLARVGPEYAHNDIRLIMMRSEFLSLIETCFPRSMLDELALNLFDYFREGDPAWHEEDGTPKKAYRCEYSLLQRLFVRYMECDQIHGSLKRKIEKLSDPLQWYPRVGPQRRREVTYHYGPTNSGKTFQALKTFQMPGKFAIYCAPLRLLALQVYQEVNRVVPCDLHTGEESKCHEGSIKRSCTVELTDLSRPWDVAVIDEIQMIGDEERGGAWTRAFLGLNAEQIHLCGDASVLELIRDICTITGDNLVTVNHRRRSRLCLEPEPKSIEAGDCYVAFSERDLRNTKFMISNRDPEMKCTLIYGSLPPEIKIEAGNRFREDAATNGVLVATDAIGMGLNLPIRRVIFTSTEKFNGNFVAPLKASLVKQIAGRAGRGCEDGYYTAIGYRNLNYVRDCMNAPVEPVKQAVLELDPSILPIIEHQWRKFGHSDNRSFAQFLLGITCHEFCVSVGNVRKPLFRFKRQPRSFYTMAQLLESCKDICARITVSDYFKLCICPGVKDNKRARYKTEKLDVNSWILSCISNMFVFNQECFLKIYGPITADTVIAAYGMVRAYKYLYTQFPAYSHLMPDYHRLDEVELEINNFIRSVNDLPKQSKK